MRDKGETLLECRKRLKTNQESMGKKQYNYLFFFEQAGGCMCEQNQLKGYDGELYIGVVQKGLNGRELNKGTVGLGEL